jgi:hypothetical protein
MVRFHQAPHRRISRRGKPFTAGRGLPKIMRNYGSQIRRDMIREDLKTEGPNREKIVRIMEKDPLLWKEYKMVEKPNIKLIRGYLKDTGNYAESNLKSNSINMEPSLFEKFEFERENGVKNSDFYRPDKVLDSSMFVNPHEIISHEVQHIKDKKNTEEYGSVKPLLEDSAFWRSQFNIKKSKKPKRMLDIELREAFNSDFLEKEVTKK